MSNFTILLSVLLVLVQVDFCVMRLVNRSLNPSKFCDRSVVERMCLKVLEIHVHQFMLGELFVDIER